MGGYFNMARVLPPGAAARCIQSYDRRALSRAVQPGFYYYGSGHTSSSHQARTSGAGVGARGGVRGIYLPFCTAVSPCLVAYALYSP